MKRRVSIIGFGSFGRFMASHLRGHAEVSVCDRTDISAAAGELGVRAVSLSEAAAVEIIVLAVPVQHLEQLLIELAQRLETAKAPTVPLVVDVASVKIRPIEMMTRLLPAGVSIVGTHPLFGPQSGKDGIAGLPIAFCPVRAASETVEFVRSFLSETLKLRVVDVTPEEHDRDMAYVQGLTHLLSRALGEMALPETPLATIAYQRLLATRSNLRHDSWELFLTIERENPFAEDVRKMFDQTLERIEKRLAGE